MCVGWYHSPGVFTTQFQAFEGGCRACFPPLAFIQEAKDGAAQNPIASTKPVLANLVKVKISTVRVLGLGRIKGLTPWTKAWDLLARVRGPVAESTFCSPFPQIQGWRQEGELDLRNQRKWWWPEDMREGS